MASPAAVLQILVTANTASANAALARTDAQLKRTSTTANTASSAVGTKFAKAAKIGGAAAGGALAYGLYKSLKVGAEFEKEMDSLGAVTQATTKDMARMEKQALRLGQKTAFSASEAAAAQIELAKGGLAVKDILGGALPASLSLAAAGELELADAASTTVNAMKLFELGGKQSAQVADMLATAANTTTADVADFAMALKQGGSAAKQAGLDLNDAITILEALAEAGIKNSDAGTSMKAAILQLLAPTDKQKALAEKLNLEFVNQAGNMKNAAQIANELRDSLGGYSNAERVATLRTLAGTDGFRALAALYDAGGEKLRSLAKANSEMGTAQEIANQKMDNTAGSVEQLSGALETLGIKVFKYIGPPFRALVDGATAAVTKFTETLFSKKSAKTFEDFGDSFRALGQGIQGVWEDVIMPIVRALGPGFARSLEGTIDGIKGAVNVIAGILTLDLGRAWDGVKQMFGGVGKFFLGVFEGAIAVVKAPVKALAKALTAPVRAAVGALRTAVVFGFDKILGAVSTALGAIADSAGAFDWLPGVGGKLGNLADSARAAQDGIDNFRESIKGNQAEKAKQDALGHVGDAFDALGDIAGVNERRLDKALDGMRGSMSDAISKFRVFTGEGAKAMDKAGDDSRDMGKRFATNFKSVGKITKSLAAAVGQGLDTIGKNTNSLLKGLKVGSVSYSIAKAGKGVMDGAAQFKQRGGPINMGAPSGDTVPAMLERGEYVLNREAVKKVGTKQLDAINFAAAPRFQKGGSVAAMAADADRIDAMRMNYVWGGSHGSSPAPHGGPFDCSSAVSHILQHGGGYDIPTMVSGQLANLGKPGKGPVTIYANPEHVLMSINDRFWGTSSSNPGGGPGWIPTPSASYLSGFAARVPDGIVGMATKVARQILKGPKGPWREGGQAAFDKARSAANAFIMKQGSPLGGNSNLNMLTGPGKTVGASVYGFGEAGTGTVGASGRNLIGVPAYAELDMGTALGGLPFGKQLKITAPGGRSMVGVKEDIGLGGGSVGGLPRAIDLWRDLAEPLGLDGSFLGQVKVQGLQHGGLVQRLAKGGQPKFTGSMTTWNPDTSGVKLSEPFKTAEKMRAVLDRIGLIDERIEMADGRAGLDGLFTAAERQHAIQLNTDLLRSLIETRDYAQFGLDKSTQMLGRNSTPSWQKKLIRDVMPTFTETLLDTQGLSGKGGRIFDTLITLANLKNTVPDAPAGRGSILEAIESSIALAGLTDPLDDDITGYRALVHYWTQALDQLQNAGAPFSEIGSAASALRSAQDTLTDLLGGSGSTARDTSELDALKLAQAMDTIRRLNVGIAQNSVFAGMPVMHDGGVVPGPRGADVPIMAQAGETVIPAGAGSGELRIIVEDHRIRAVLDGREVEVIAGSVVDRKLGSLGNSRSYGAGGQIGAGR